MSTPRKKRARKHEQHDLMGGSVLVRHSHDRGASIRVGLPDGGGSLEFQVRETQKRGIVQLHVNLFDRYGDPLGSSMFLGQRMPQLAWAFLDTRTGRMWQEQESADEDEPAREREHARPDDQIGEAP